MRFLAIAGGVIIGAASVLILAVLAMQAIVQAAAHILEILTQGVTP